jgi:hypothetical protein
MTRRIVFDQRLALPSKCTDQRESSDSGDDGRHFMWPVPLLLIMDVFAVQKNRGPVPDTIRKNNK